MSQGSFRNEQEDIRELLRLYDSLKSGRPSVSLSEDSFERIIEHFDDQDDLGSALEAADRGMEQHPYSASLMVKKADLLIATRKYHQALKLLDRAEILDSNDIDIFILRTDAYLALDQQEKAIKLLEDAIERFSGEDRLNLLFELADVYDDYEEFDKIFDCLAMILELEPGNEEALYKICFWTDFTGRNEESIALHQRIIDEQPYSELAWFNLAAAYQGLKLYEKAVDAYKYAIVINEKFDYAYRNMADAYIRMRRYRDAIEALEKVAELSRPEDVIYEAIGHCYDRMRNHALARFHYRKASHLNPEDAKLQHKIALTYLNERNWTKAMKYLETALRLNPKSHDLNLSMGEALRGMGRFREALDHLRVAVALKPRNISSWESYIFTCYEAGSLEDAQGIAVTALQQTGGKPVFLYYRAALLFALGRQKAALSVLESALQAAPRQFRKLATLDASLLGHPSVAELVARYRKRP